MSDLIRRFDKSRQGYLGFLTRLCNEIDVLLSDYGNVVKVKDIQLKLNGALEKYKQSSATLMELLNPDLDSEQLINLIDLSESCTQDITSKNFFTYFCLHILNSVCLVLILLKRKMRRMMGVS